MKSKKRETEEILEEEVVEKVEKIEVPEYYLLGMSETISDVAKKFGLEKEEIERLNDSKVFFGGNQIKLR